jgi:hypothetical protein
MDELLESNFSVAEKDRPYRCLDRVLEHKQELFVFLKQKWADLFAADFEVLLYELTSTYFEGEMEQNPKAKRGYSRDARPDCLQLVIALVVTGDRDAGKRLVRLLRKLRYLRFRNTGAVYRLFEFTAANYQTFLKSESKGRFFRSQVRDHFRYERMAKVHAA